MKGYKAFDENLKCQDFNFKVGETYKIDGDHVVGKNGFCFCPNISFCYLFAPVDYKTRICEVEALGEIVSDHNSIIFFTNEIKIVKEISNCFDKAYFEVTSHLKKHLTKYSKKSPTSKRSVGRGS